MAEKGIKSKWVRGPDVIKYTPRVARACATFTGSADRFTELFAIPSQQIRISWDLNLGQYSTFWITLYEFEASYQTESWHASDQPNGNTMAYISQGTYYLEFTAADTNYEVTIEVCSSLIFYGE